jgi:MFS family permease
VGIVRRPRWPGLLGEAPRFRYLWLSRSISATGTGAGRVALVLLVAASGPRAVSGVLLCTALPQLLGPAAGAVADLVDQRRLLACCEAGQGVVYAVIAAARPPLPALLVLVTVAGTLAAAMSPAGKGSIARLVPAGRLPQANALIGLALNLQLVAGPAVGGALAGLAGLTAAFALNAGSFFASALLLTRLGPLPPLPGVTRDGVMAEVRDGLRYAARHRLLRALLLGTLVFVSFAAVDNVALVFLVRGSLHGSAAGYGAATASFGVGMVVASVALTAWASRRTAAYWLIGGIVAGAVGTAATGVAPVLGLACAGQVLAGAGNTADLVGTDTLIQQSVPAGLLGRAFGVVYASAQLAAVAAYSAGSLLVGYAGPRATFLIAGTGTLAGLFILGPALASKKP